MTAQAHRIDGLTPGAIPAEILTSREPVVLPGLVSGWPCVEAAQSGDVALLQYLRGVSRDKDILAFLGPCEAEGRFFYDADLGGFNFNRITAKLGVLLDKLEAGFDEGHLYLGSTAVDEYFPGFRQANDLDLGALNPLVSIWMGNRSRIAAHFDSPQNIACVVAGRRRFTLFPPEQLENLYIGPIDVTPAGQAISLVDFAAPDFERFPRFRDALDAARVVDLDPGDALFLPGMWWHHVEGLAPLNVLVNYWWSASAGVSGNPLNALIHALMTIGDLPVEQRAAWRHLFDYYVFDEAGDRFDHIPGERRGVLGDMDEQMLAQVRSILRDKLGA